MNTLTDRNSSANRYRQFQETQKAMDVLLRAERFLRGTPPGRSQDLARRLFEQTADAAWAFMDAIRESEPRRVFQRLQRAGDYLGGCRPLVDGLAEDSDDRVDEVIPLAEGVDLLATMIRWRLGDLRTRLRTAA